ncbi:MAG: dihydroorotate dehydrogenase (quinone), partial [Deltaproteobacteria bacterium]|nr:dihydroorotate dehydrogenase (quinone) [Deltaproteobacteria bacterium]
VYSAFVYAGPSLPKSLAAGLQALLKRDGLTLQQAIGVDAK